MKQVIELNNLDCLKVADKCLHLDENGFSIVAKKIIAGDQNKKISLQEVQQLFKLGQNAGYMDWWIFGLNVLRNIDGKLIFIDTEDGSYTCSGVKKEYNAQHLINSFGHKMDKDAKEWLNSECDRLDKSPEGQGIIIGLPKNPQYDAEIGIDFEVVKREYKKLQEDLD